MFGQQYKILVLKCCCGFTLYTSKQFAFTVLYPWSLFALHILVPVLAGRSHRIMYRSKIHRLESCSFIKKETLAQVFSCKFYEISKNTFLTEHLRTTASACSGLYFCLCLLTIRIDLSQPLMSCNTSVFAVFSFFSLTHFVSTHCQESF